MYGKKLEEDIISDTSGHFKRLMVSLASVNIESSKILLNQNIWQLRLSVWLFFYLCFPCALHVFYLCFTCALYLSGRTNGEPECGHEEGSGRCTGQSDVLMGGGGIQGAGQMYTDQSGVLMGGGYTGGRANVYRSVRRVDGGGGIQGAGQMYTDQ